jgi:FkbM family methyltransferase
MRSMIKAMLGRLGYDIVRTDRSAFAFTAHARRLGIDLVFDVGANIGQYALQLRSSGYASRIISFEPVIEAYAELARRSRADPDWTVLNLALGSEIGEATLNVGQQTEMSSFHRIRDRHAELHAWARMGHAQSTSVTRLDEIFDTYAGPDDRVLLKMDVQGFETEVMAGARRSLSRIAAIQMEMAVMPSYSDQPDMLTQVNSLEAAGFRLVDLVNGGRDREGCLIEVDGFFVRS